jgi:plasmid stabilization system protein ParE
MNGGVNYTSKYLPTIYKKIESASQYPLLGIPTSIKNTRSVLAGKHNRIYYRIEKNKIIVLNIRDTRRNPAKNPFKKKQ